MRAVIETLGISLPLALAIAASPGAIIAMLILFAICFFFGGLLIYQGIHMVLT